MAKVQKSYTQELKREAVRLAQTSGKSIADVTLIEIALGMTVLGRHSSPGYVSPVVYEQGMC